MNSYHDRRLVGTGPLFLTALLLIPASADAQAVAYRDLGNSLVVTNRFYTASVTKGTGELEYVVDRIHGDTAIAGDRLVVRLQGHQVPNGTAGLSATHLSIEDGYSFYVRALWTDTVSGSGGLQRIERTFEFTNSPIIYEQVAIVDGKAPAAAPGPVLPQDDVTWEFRRQNTNVRIGKATDDLWTDLPIGRLGGLQLNLFGLISRTSFVDSATNSVRRIVASTVLHNRRSTKAVLAGGPTLLATTMVAVVGGLPDESLSQQPQFWFYPGYGLRRKNSDTTVTFINWNNYDLMNRLIPLRRKYLDTPTANDWFDEDMLIRVAMHLVHRMRLDGGWPRWPSWSGAVTYPDGDIFTAHSRAFPAMAYLWSYLTVNLNQGQWTHSNSDADVIYDQLQQLRRFYGLAPDTSGVNFRDHHDGVDYIAYSANRKEAFGNGPRGVLNSHAQALSFAGIMRDASELRGIPEDSIAWSHIVQFYQPGSKMLFGLLYPGAGQCRHAPTAGVQTRSQCDSLSGHLAYGIDFPCVYPGCRAVGAHPLYSLISYEGIADGYLHTGEYEPEFVDAVERASRLQYNPYAAVSPVPLGPMVARLCRILPLALAFTNDTVSMTVPAPGSGSVDHPVEYDIAAAGLRELTTFAVLRYHEGVNTTRTHDPRKPIGEGGEQGFRKVIWTNQAFITDWIPGFWQEMDSADIPPNMRFSVEVQRPNGGRLGNWAAYQMGNRIEFMADFDSGVAVLKIPSTSAHTAYILGYRDYDARSMRWKDPIAGSVTPLPSGGAIVLPSLTRKRLVFVELR